jgi:N-formylglutamate amidohydrolase
MFGSSSPLPPGTSLAPGPVAPAYMLLPPDTGPSAVVCASPHSGRIYPGDLLDALGIDLLHLRQVEDFAIDRLFSFVPRYHAPLIRALYARTYVDLNRAIDEIDPTMFTGGTPGPARPSVRVDAGLGCMPRLASGGAAIYARKLTRAEGQARLQQVYAPYHKALSSHLKQARDLHGRAVLIDAHSMPSQIGGRAIRHDIVLGDRFGTSCDKALIDSVEARLRAEGLSVARNAPYAGGYSTQTYGRPGRGSHALQIEINRGLYLNETKVQPLPAFSALGHALERALGPVFAHDWQALTGQTPPLANAAE